MDRSLPFPSLVRVVDANNGQLLFATCADGHVDDLKRLARHFAYLAMEPYLQRRANLAHCRMMADFFSAIDAELEAEQMRRLDVLALHDGPYLHDIDEPRTMRGGRCFDIAEFEKEVGYE